MPAPRCFHKIMRIIYSVQVLTMHYLIIELEIFIFYNFKFTPICIDKISYL